MTQPANAPTSRMAAAEQVATRLAQKPTGQWTHGGTTTLSTRLPRLLQSTGLALPPQRTSRPSSRSKTREWQQRR